MTSALSSLSGEALLMQFLSLCVFAPICEEVIFRLGVQTYLLKRMTAFRAGLASTLLFGLAHALLRSSSLLGLAVLPLGGLNAYIFSRTRRVWPCIAIHALANALWLLMSSLFLLKVSL